MVNLINKEGNLVLKFSVCVCGGGGDAGVERDRVST